MQIFRALPVCIKCWNNQYPHRPAIHVKGNLKQSPEKIELCIVCNEPATDGIFVRMKIEWDVKL